MAIKNSQSKGVALANMLKQNATKNQRMASYMSPTGAAGGLQSLTNPGNVPQNTGINQLLRPAQSSLSNIYNPSVQPTQTGLTSNLRPPSNAIVGMSRDEMMKRYAEAKANQVNNPSGQQQMPAYKGPTQAQWGQMKNQPAIGYESAPSLGGQQGATYLSPEERKAYFANNPSVAYQTPQMQQEFFMNNLLNRGQQPITQQMPRPADSYTGFLDPRLAGTDAAFGNSRGFGNQLSNAGGLGKTASGQPNAPAGGKVNQPMPSTGYPKMDWGTFVDPIRSFNNGATPARNTQADSLGAVALGQPTQSYPKQSQAPARRPVNRGKLNQLMPTPGV